MYLALDVEDIPGYRNKPLPILYEKLPTFDGASLSAVPHFLAFMRHIIHALIRLFIFSLRHKHGGWIKQLCSPKAISFLKVLIEDFLKY